jgi:hypothetical protein
VITEVTRFTTKMGTPLIKVKMINEESVSKIIRKKKLLRNAGQKFQSIFVFPHRPKVIRDALTMARHGPQFQENGHFHGREPSQSFQRYTSMKDLNSNYGNINQSFYSQNHLNRGQDQREWMYPNRRW